MNRPHHQSGNCWWHLNYINNPRAMEYLEVCESFKVASLRSRLSIPMPPSIHPFKFNCIDVKIYRKMRELPWITIFRSRVGRFAGDFHEWLSDEWKSSANPITCDPKIVIHGNVCIILFPTCYLMSWAHITAKIYRSLISPLSQRNVFSDSDLWRTQSWSVSRERRLLILWRHIRRLFLHAQTGT